MGMQSYQYTDCFCMLHTNHVDSHSTVAEAVMNLRQNNVPAAITNVASPNSKAAQHCVFQMHP